MNHTCINTGTTSDNSPLPACAACIEDIAASAYIARGMKIARSREWKPYPGAPSSMPEGLLVLEPTIHRDDRGFFFESYKKSDYAALGITDVFVQRNFSWSRKHTIRGLHMQTGQAKLVSCLRGKIIDVAVDLRPQSPTLRMDTSVELSEENRRQFFVPAGFAHGFLVVSDFAEVEYLCSTEYDPEFEAALRWNDPWLGNGHWARGQEPELWSPILSDRDAQAQSWEEYKATAPAFSYSV